MIDIHSHILPGIDDGSSSVEESLKMLQMETAQGIGHVVATPHFYANHDTPEHFLARRAQAEAALRQEMAKYPGLPEISVGAEVYFFRGMSESEYLPQLTINKKCFILIEMPHAPWSDAMFQELQSIWDKRKIVPVIAHIDRYICPLHKYHIPQRLMELPVLVQANADFFLDRGTSGMAMKMLKKDQIHLLGSDCHNMSSRKPNLGDALQRIRQKLGPEAIEQVRSYERKIFDV